MKNIKSKKFVINDQLNNEKCNKWIFYILTFGVLIRCAFFVFFQFKDGMHCDEMMLLLNARSLVDNGTDIMGEKFPIYFDTWLYGGQSPMATYLAAIFIKVFGYSVVVSRIPAFLANIVSLFAIKGTVKELFGNSKVTVAVFAVGNFSPWYIFQYAWTFDCAYFPYCFIIALYFLTKAVNGKKARTNYIISMLFFGLCFYCYIASVLIVPIFLACFYLVLIKNKKISFNNIAISVITIVLISTPFILFGLIQLNVIKEFTAFGFSFTKMPYYSRASSITIFSNSSFVSKIGNVFENLIYELICFTFPDVCFLIGGIYHFTYTNFVGGLFVIIGVIYAIKNFKKAKEIQQVFMIASFVSFIVFSLLQNDIIFESSYRFSCFYLMLFVLEGIGIIAFASVLKRVNWKAVIILFLMTSLILSYVTLQTKYEKCVQTQKVYSETFYKSLDFGDEHSKSKLIIVNDAPNKNSKESNKEYNQEISVYLRYKYYGSHIDSSFENEMKARGYIEQNSAGQNIKFNKKYEYQSISNDDKLTQECYIISTAKLRSMKIDKQYKIKSFGYISVVYKE